MLFLYIIIANHWELKGGKKPMDRWDITGDKNYGRKKKHVCL